jgi:hypothetical protein
MTVVLLTPIVQSSQALPGGPPGVAGPAGAAAAYKINGQSGTTAYVPGPADGGALIIFSGTTSGVALTLNPAVLTPGWWTTIKNNNTSGLITITTIGGALLDGTAMGTIDPKYAQTIVYSGQNFDTLEPGDGGTF